MALEAYASQFDHLELYESAKHDPGRYQIAYKAQWYIDSLTLLQKLILMARRRPEVIPKIRELVSDPNQLNEVGPQGWTPLMIACRNSNRISTEEVVSILIAAGKGALLLHPGKFQISEGADLNAQTDFGRTALMEAAEYSTKDSTINTVRMLLAGGADVNIQDNNGYTALCYAIEYSGESSNLETVRMLIDAGANVNHRIRLNEYTPLHCAIYRSLASEDVVPILIQANADVNLTERYDGETPIMGACAYASETVISQLEAVADLNILNQNGQSFLSYYTIREMPNVARLIDWHDRGYRFRTEDGIHLSFEARQSILEYYLNDDLMSTRIIDGHDQLWNYFYELKFIQRYQQERRAIFRRVLAKLIPYDSSSIESPSTEPNIIILH